MEIKELIIDFLEIEFRNNEFFQSFFKLKYHFDSNIDKKLYSHSKMQFFFSVNYISIVRLF